MKKFIICFVLLCSLSYCTTQKYTAKNYEHDRYKGCPTYGFDRTENKYHYFSAPRLYQQTNTYKYGPWYKHAKRK